MRRNAKTAATSEPAFWHAANEKKQMKTVHTQTKGKREKQKSVLLCLYTAVRLRSIAHNLVLFSWATTKWFKSPSSSDLDLEIQNAKQC